MRDPEDEFRPKKLGGELLKSAQLRWLIPSCDKSRHTAYELQTILPQTKSLLTQFTDKMPSAAQHIIPPHILHTRDRIAGGRLLAVAIGNGKRTLVRPHQAVRTNLSFSAPSQSYSDGNMTKRMAPPTKLRYRREHPCHKFKNIIRPNVYHCDRISLSAWSPYRGE